MSGKLHALYSPSSSERWLECPGSIQLSQRPECPEPKESRWAKEGTDAHTCLELLLKNRTRMAACEKMLLRRYPKEMVAHGVKAARFIIKKQGKRKHVELLTETKSRCDFIDPELHGTTDTSIVELFGTLTVIDYKYGAGIPVSPVENTQVIIYALGIAHRYHYNFQNAELGIYQPRIHADEPYSNWYLSMDELMAWIPKLKKGIANTKVKRPKFWAGDHCRFCPAKEICEEYSNRALREAQKDFDTEPAPFGIDAV